jgi:hypothetical protein
MVGPSASTPTQGDAPIHADAFSQSPKRPPSGPKFRAYPARSLAPRKFYVFRRSRARAPPDRGPVKYLCGGWQSLGEARAVWRLAKPTCLGGPSPIIFFSELGPGGGGLCPGRWSFRTTTPWGGPSGRSANGGAEVGQAAHPRGSIPPGKFHLCVGGRLGYWDRDLDCPSHLWRT